MMCHLAFEFGNSIEDQNSTPRCNELQVFRYEVSEVKSRLQQNNKSQCGGTSLAPATSDLMSAVSLLNYTNMSHHFIVNSTTIEITFIVAPFRLLWHLKPFRTP